MQVRISKELLNNIFFYEKINQESNDFFILNVEELNVSNIKIGTVISAEMTYDGGLGVEIKTIKED